MLSIQWILRDTHFYFYFFSVWSKSTPPAPDNGTSAWGEPNESSPGWGEMDDAGASTTGWGSTPASAPSAMKPSK